MLITEKSSGFSVVDKACKCDIKDSTSGKTVGKIEVFTYLATVVKRNKTRTFGDGVVK